MTKVKDLKSLNKKQLDKLRKGILAAMGNSTNVQQPIAVNKVSEVKKSMPFPNDSRDRIINSGKGLDHIYGTKPAKNQEDYPEGLNPFDSELKKRKLSALEIEWFSYFKSAIVTAKSPSKMHEVVDKAIDIGMRMNGCHENNWSFAEYVILGMQMHKFKKNDQKKVMHKLMLKGAEFHDHLLENKLIGEIHKELRPKVQPQIEKQLEERRKAAKNAVRGGDVIVVEMDNETTLTEYSKGSTVEIAKALNTGPNKELESHIIKIDGGELEIRKKEGGKRNYTDVLGGFEITFPTSIGGLVVIVYHDVKNYDQIQVRVVDTEMLSKLQAKGEEIGKNCLFGGMKIEEAVKRGSFPRSGFLSEKKAASETLSSSSWEGRISGGSQETIRTC
ncbi:MAG: hypothetical protein LBJ80_00510 [Rickettsiales bacterium]|jgi:hypothetical protein|nr:hypothetical protein [Rickettsiales bacterium]MDR1260894.1 hypothetical protein [Rickettsiales bacterium]